MVKSSSYDMLDTKVYHVNQKPKFRVPISSSIEPPISRIRAIAEYKMKKIKKAKEVDGDLKISDTVGTISSSNSSKNSNSQPVTTTMLKSTISNQVKDEETIKMIIQKSNSSTESIIKEWDTMNKSSESIRKEMLALASIRNSLLWLLRKATLNENTRNHLHS